MDDLELATRLLRGDPTLFEGDTAARSLGWLTHVEHYLGTWLDDVDARRPRRHARTLLLGMGGSSSPARFYAESKTDSELGVLDTSNPDTIAATVFSGATVIASSKSGATIETQTLLAHALNNGLDARDLVVISDPGTTLGELATSLGALLVEGDPHTGGRFSGLSPFGLLPALYAGWTPTTLREELASCSTTPDVVHQAIADVHGHLVNGYDANWFALGDDPITSGGALWLEQLIAETTGKQGRGFVPVVDGPPITYRPSSMQHYHLVAALLARELGVDPFNQPNVESAKTEVFALLQREVSWNDVAIDVDALRTALANSTYNVIQAFAPFELANDLATLRATCVEAYGPTTANFGPRYLHSTGQLHKGGPSGDVAVQVVVRPRSRPVRISGRGYSFHDLHMAQAQSDVAAMRGAGRDVFQLIVDNVDEAARIMGLQT